MQVLKRKMRSLFGASWVAGEDGVRLVVPSVGLVPMCQAPDSVVTPNLAHRVCGRETDSNSQPWEEVCSTIGLTAVQAVARMEGNGGSTGVGPPGRREQMW